VLDREVALKVPRAAALESPEARARFLREPKAAAQLRHPNIVPVYDAGVDGDRYYIASAYIEGRTLEDVIAEARPDFRRAARIVSDLAIALDYAHRTGVVHRDVKPANVMVDEQGQPMLMDFGLARLEASEEKLTQDGSLMGTPAYMAPEQADNSLGEVSAASDQYSLGVVLYELLTGETPFSGPPTILVFNAIHQEPPPPRSIQPEIPRDLETICLKAMSKRAPDRYGDCGAMADDLRRWLADEPIVARPMGPVERFQRWCRRNPAIAALSATALALVLLVATVTTIAYFQTSEALARESTARAEADRHRLAAETALKKEADQRLKAEAAAERESAARKEADLARQTAEEAQRKAEEALAKAASEQQRATAAQQQADTLAEEVAGWEGKGLGLYRERLLLAQQKWLSGDLTQAQALLDECPADLRHWEWGFLKRACQAEVPLVLSARHQTEGRPRQNWDDLVAAVAFTPDGERVVCQCRGGEVHVWLASDGKPLLTLSGPRVGETAIARGSLALSPNGAFIAAAGEEKDTVTVWDTASGKEVFTSQGHKCHLGPGVFSADGNHIALGCEDGTVRVWNLALGQQSFQIQVSTGPVTGVAFGPENFLATASGAFVRVWDVQQRATVATMTGAGKWVRFDEQGGYLWALAQPRVLKWWTLTNFGSGAERQVHKTDVLRVGGEPFTFSPDGSCIAFPTADYKVEVWSPRQQRLACSLPAHPSNVKAIAFGPDSNIMATATDEVVQLWNRRDIRSGNEKPVRIIAESGGAATPFSMAFSPDGETLAVGFQDCVRLHRVVPRWMPRPVDSQGGYGMYQAWGTGARALSPDGKRYATTRGVWDATTNEKLFDLPTDKYHTESVAFSPDGTRIATVGGDITPTGTRHVLRLWDASAGEELLTVETGQEYADDVQFSPDGARVATKDGEGHTLKLWNPSDGKEVFCLGGEDDASRRRVYDFAFSADGKEILLSCFVGLMLCDAATGNEILAFNQGGYAGIVAFSPDGERIVSSKTGAELTLWHARTGQELLTLPEPIDDTGYARARDLEFSPDGLQIAVNGEIWEAADWRAEEAGGGSTPGEN